MKKKLVGIILTILFLPTLFLTTVFAATDNEKKIVVLPKNETVDRDYFAAGDSVTLSGTINGDAYVAGGNVLVDGTINGDLMAAGGVVTVRGTVKNDIRVAGGQVVVASNIGGNVTALGGSIDMTETATISGSLVAGGGNVQVFGPVGKGITVGAGQLTLANSVNGDVLAGIGQMNITPNAKINGALNYWSEEEAYIQDGASISGKVVFNKPEKKEVDRARVLGALAGVGIAFKMVEFVSSLAIGLLLLKFVPVYTKRTASALDKKPWQSLLYGFLTIVITPVLFVVLCLTVIGIPIAFVLLGFFFIMAYLAKVFVAVVIGQRLLEASNYKLQSGWIFLIGMVIYTLTTIIPGIGWLISAFITLFGLGAIVIEETEFYNTLRSKKLI